MIDQIQIKQRLLSMLSMLWTRLRKGLSEILPLLHYGLKHGEWTPLKNYVIQRAADFFDIEMESDGEAPKEDKPKKRWKKIVKVLLFPFVIIGIIIAVLIKKDQKKQRKNNYYIKA